MGHSTTGPAVLVALAAALAFGLASALQHEQAMEVAPGGRGLLSLLHRSRWLIGIVFDTLAVVLQAVALGLGSVTLVQPLLVSGLPVAAALSANLEARRLHRHEVAGLVATTLGLAVLAPAVVTTSDSSDPSRVAALVAAAVVAAAVGLLLLVGRHGGRRGAVALGVAAGAVTGAGSPLLAVVADRVGHPLLLLGTWAPYGLALVGLAGLWLTQVAFQSGALGAPLAALSVAEPVVAVVLAVAVLHEHLPTDVLDRATALVGVALSVVGVLLLCRQPAPGELGVGVGVGAGPGSSDPVTSEDGPTTTGRSAVVLGDGQERTVSVAGLSGAAGAVHPGA